MSAVLVDKTFQPTLNGMTVDESPPFYFLTIRLDDVVDIRFPIPENVGNKSNAVIQAWLDSNYDKVVDYARHHLKDKLKHVDVADMWLLVQKLKAKL